MPKRGRTRIIGHRGASAIAPENTLAAFRLARELGADGFELDCMLAGDGEVVVIHDSTLDRTTDGHGRVADHTVAQLQALSAGRWKSPAYADERVPTLAQALELVDERFEVLVEAKAGPRDDALIAQLRAAAAGPTATARRDGVRAILASASHPDIALARAIARVVNASGRGEWAIVMSFSIIVVATVACEAAPLRTMLLAAPERDASTDTPQWENALWWADALDLSGLGLLRSMYTPARIDALHAAGRVANAWTVNAPPDMDRFARAGIDYITTDLPDIAVEHRDAVTPP